MTTDTPDVEEQIQRSLANDSRTELEIKAYDFGDDLTVTDARRIIHCFRENRRFDTLTIIGKRLRDPAVVNVLRDGLPLCTAVTTIHLRSTELDLVPALYSTPSITKVSIHGNDHIRGQHVGEVLRDLLVGNNTLLELILCYNFRIHPEAAIGFGHGLADNHGLVVLSLSGCEIGNDGLADLLLSMGEEANNNSLLDLDLRWNRIEGEDGGRQVSLLLQCFTALKVLRLGGNRLLGPLGARALAPGLAAAASQLEELWLYGCGLGNDGVANLVPGGQENRSLTHLRLSYNDIEGAEGAGQVSLLLQRFPSLKVLILDSNNLGPLGACALAPGLAAASHLEELVLYTCCLGNDGVANLVPDGEVNSSLTNLDISQNGIHGLVGGENVVALVSRCTNLDSINVHGNSLSPGHHRHLNLLWDRKRLCTAAQALGGSPFSVLFRAVEEAHRHEHGLSAIFVILQNDGDDYFCTALNHAME